jgi:hypothetical protein
MSEYVYYVEYFCKEEYEARFQRYKEYERKKFNTILTRKQFEADGENFYDSYECTEYYIDFDEAEEIAKKLSLETGEETFMLAGWLTPSNLKYAPPDFEEDENYFKTYDEGEELT